MLLEVFLKYNIAQIIDVENSFFYSSTLPSGTKLTRELIELNYRRYSPFINFDMIYYIDDDYLYIWFIKDGVKKIENNLVLIPNTFLLYKQLNQKDGIYVCDMQIKQVLVIKNSRLLSASFFEELNDDALAIMRTEYQLENIVYLAENEINSLYKQAKKEFEFIDILKFSRVQVDRKRVVDFLIEKMTYPLVGLILVYMLISYTQAYLMQEEISKKSEEFLQLKSKNTTVNRAIHQHNKMVDKYQNFSTKELQHTDPYRVLFDMYKVIKKSDKAILRSLKISNGIAKIQIETNEDPIKYLERLNKITYFKDVVIQSAIKRKYHKKIITYSLRVKVVS